jgi:hypothetical protein
MLPLLENSLQNLKKLKPEFFSPFDNSKKLVNDSHSRLLQIFYLDRENEAAFESRAKYREADFQSI